MTISTFDHGLLSQECVLELPDGQQIVLASARWRDTPDVADNLLLSACQGPTIDLGCGPGRLTEALLRRGIAALGVDVSPVAVRMTTDRGALALQRDVFERLPGEGRWRHVLLADGNIGIGGNPAALLTRVRALLHPTGSVLAEVDPPGSGFRSSKVRLSHGPEPRYWFEWAWLAADQLEQIAAEAKLRIKQLLNHENRWFAELELS